MRILPHHEKAAGFSPEGAATIRTELGTILKSSNFSGSKRCQDFLEFIVQQALDGNYDYLTERFLGAELFGRPINYETGTDSIVRVRANDVRRRLAQYYSEGHGGAQVVIELASGNYVPEFHWLAPKAADTAPDVASHEAPTMPSGASHQELIATLPMAGSGNDARAHRWRIFVGVILIALVLGLMFWLVAARASTGSFPVSIKIRTVAEFLVVGFRQRPATRNGCCALRRFLSAPGGYREADIHSQRLPQPKLSQPGHNAKFWLEYTACFDLDCFEELWELQ